MSADTAKDGPDFTMGRFLEVVRKKNDLTENLELVRSIAGQLEAQHADLTTRMATALAAVKGLHCTCWDYEAMEQERLEQCERCIIIAALTLVPEAPDYDHNADWTPPEWIEAQQ